MSDNSAAEKGALHLVWPLATQLLCHFHVDQAERRYLWARSNIPKLAKKELMKVFQQVKFTYSTFTHFCTVGAHESCVKPI